MQIYHISHLILALKPIFRITFTVFRADLASKLIWRITFCRFDPDCGQGQPILSFYLYFILLRKIR